MDNLTFYEYLSQQVENGVTDDPAGDFALDAEADSFFPRSVKADAEGFAYTFNYLYHTRSVWSDVIDAFMECWQAYYKDVTNRDWYE